MTLPSSTWQWLGGADNATATLLSCGAIFLGLRELGRRTILRRRRFRQALDSLAIGINPEYATAVLGPPAFGRLSESGRGALTWVSVHGFVQVCFAAGGAEQIAITLTDPLLRYEVSTMTRGVLRGRLGRSVTSDWGPPDVYAATGARRAWCVLTWYGGNPGGYLHYSAAYLDASGLGDYPSAVLRSTESAYANGRFAVADMALPTEELVAAIERELVPNTVIVSRRGEWLTDRVFGVDLDEVRLLRRKCTWAEAAFRRCWRLRWSKKTPTSDVQLPA